MIKSAQTTCGLFGPRTTSRDRRDRQFRLVEMEVEILIDELFADGKIPNLVRVECNGQRADDATMETARLALRKLPRSMLKALIGKRIEITGDTIDANFPSAIGIANDAGAKVAGRLDGEILQLTVLHECGHLINRLRRPEIPDWLSSTVRWSNVWKTDLENGLVPESYNQREYEFEYLAESFARYFFSPRTRAELSPAVRSFMESLSKRFEK